MRFSPSIQAILLWRPVLFITLTAQRHRNMICFPFHYRPLTPNNSSLQKVAKWALIQFWFIVALWLGATNLGVHPLTCGVGRQNKTGSWWCTHVDSCLKPQTYKYALRVEALIVRYASQWKFTLGSSGCVYQTSPRGTNQKSWGFSHSYYLQEQPYANNGMSVFAGVLRMYLPNFTQKTLIWSWGHSCWRKTTFRNNEIT